MLKCIADIKELNEQIKARTSHEPKRMHCRLTSRNVKKPCQVSSSIPTERSVYEKVEKTKAFPSKHNKNDKKSIERSKSNIKNARLDTKHVNTIIQLNKLRRDKYLQEVSEMSKPQFCQKSLNIIKKKEEEKGYSNNKQTLDRLSKEPIGYSEGWREAEKIKIIIDSGTTFKPKV